jgi:hypothetical protein
MPEESLRKQAEAELRGLGTVAQNDSGGQTVGLDCSAFQRQADGTWRAIRQTTIVIGTNSVTNSAGLVQGTVNGVSIQGVLERQCGGTTAASAVPATEAPFVPVYAGWNSTTLGDRDCLARVEAALRAVGFTRFGSGRQMLVGVRDPYRVIARCVPEKTIVFWVVEGPDSQENDRIGEFLLTKTTR